MTLALILLMVPSRYINIDEAQQAIQAEKDKISMKLVPDQNSNDLSEGFAHML